MLTSAPLSVIEFAQLGQQVHGLPAFCGATSATCAPPLETWLSVHIIISTHRPRVLTMSFRAVACGFRMKHHFFLERKVGLVPAESLVSQRLSRQEKP
jgi:hypothetical protein